MDTIDKPTPSKWYLILVLGILLIFLSLISLWIAFGQIQVKSAIDYFGKMPCSDFPSAIPQHYARIVYCISFKFFENDMPLFASNSTNLDEVTEYGLNIKRQGQTIFINNQPLQAGERYNVVHRNYTNPWLIISTHIEMYQYVFAKPSAPDDALYISGAVSEHWQGSPFGLIILVSGIVLIMLGNWGTKRRYIARRRYVMEPSVPQKIEAGGVATGFFGWVIFSNLFYSLLDTTFVSEGHMGLNVNLFITWLPVIIATLVLFGMQRFSICAGIALAVAVNAGIWMFLLMGSINTFSEFFEWLLIAGIPFPVPFLTILAFGW